jgi:hypothetical protein
MKTSKLLLILLVIFGSPALVLYLIWPRHHLETQLYETKISPDGKWVGMVQLEVYNTAWVVNDAEYVVRLKNIGQKDSEGALVMNMQVNYPDPVPSIDWNNNQLVVTLANEQKYQYFNTPVRGIAIVVLRHEQTKK